MTADVGRVVVTGAAGLIGGAAVRLLARESVSVTALVRPGEHVDADRVVAGDATDPAVAAEAMRDADAVIHFAALPSPMHATPQEVFGNNTASTFAVLEEAAQAGIRRASIASSLSILGLPWAPRRLAPPYLPLDIGTPLQIEDPYGLSKEVDEATARMIARRYGMTIVALRFPFVADAARAEQRYKTLTDDPESGVIDAWAILSHDDAARAAWLGVTAPISGYHAVFVAAPQIATPYRTAELVARYLPDVPLHRPLQGREVPIELGPAHDLLGFRATDPQNLDVQPLPT